MAISKHFSQTGPSSRVTGLCPRNKRRRLDDSVDVEPISLVGEKRSSSQSHQRLSQARIREFLNPLPAALGPHPSGKPRTLLVNGTGIDGQLGLGTDVTEISLPRLHADVERRIGAGELGPHGVVQIVAGGMHSLVLDSNGQVWSCGVNDDMALGRETKGVNTSELESSFSLVSGLQDFNPVSIAAGDNLSLAINANGELRIWGCFIDDDHGIRGFDHRSDGPSSVLIPTTLSAFSKKAVCQIACGSNHALALTRDGLVYTWGCHTQNRLGRNIDESLPTSAFKPESLRLRDIVQIGTGQYHSFAVDHAGVVYGWGLNKSQQIGISNQPDSNSIETPNVIDSLRPDRLGGSRVIQISGGLEHTLFLLDNGEVWGCGNFKYGQLGLAKDHPAMVSIEQQNTQDVEAQRVATAKMANRSIEEEPIPNLSLNLVVPEPVRIMFPPPPTEQEPSPALSPYKEGYSSGTKIVSISAGSRYSMACSDQGVLYSWGEGNSLQLGLGDKVSTVRTPTRVWNPEIPKYSILDVSTGGQHVLLLAVEQ